MPTGYTYGIIDGKIKTFKDFGKVCMRAFLIHMRDDSNKKEYYDREPSNYHIDELNEAKIKLENAKKLSNENIIKNRKKEIRNDIKYNIKAIQEKEESIKNLKAILLKATEYIPPTKEHNGIKDFMIEQLTSTIDFDGNIEYNDKELSKLYTELKYINPDIIRLNMVEDANKDIKYHLKEYREELKRCAETNKWVSDFINSLN